VHKCTEDPLWYYQVISPEKKKAIGCLNINKVLSAVMNPKAHSGGETENEIENAYAVGDKVVRTKNGDERMLLDINKFNIDKSYRDESSLLLDDRQLRMLEHEDEYIKTRNLPYQGKTHDYYVVESPLVNGDMGFVEGIIDNEILVRFLYPDRLFLLKQSEAKIILAYCMTVHKCQGSGFPCVVFPIGDFFWNPRTNTGLNSRELLYTALSRAEKELITIGPLSILSKIVPRKTIGNRKSMLKKYLLEYSYVD